MKHLLSLLAGSAVVMACSSEAPVEPAPPPAPPVTFVIFGIVEDEAGLPLGDATAELIRNSIVIQTSSTSDSGYFSFAGVRGPMTMRIRKSGFVSESRFLDVTSDVLSRIRLIPLYPDLVLTLGATITAAVQAASPPCDPTGWDANAPCRKFHFTAPASGTLVVTVSWAGLPELDATLVTTAGTYVAYSHVAGFERILLEGRVLKGENYEVRINSYYDYQEFQLKAELVP